MDSSGTPQENHETQQERRANYLPVSPSEPPRLAPKRANYIPGQLSEADQARMTHKAERAKVNDRMAERRAILEAQREAQSIEMAACIREEQRVSDEYIAKKSEIRSLQARIEELTNAKISLPHHSDEMEYLSERQKGLLSGLNITLAEALTDIPQPLGRSWMEPTSAPSTAEKITSAPAKPPKKQLQESAK